MNKKYLTFGFCFLTFLFVNIKQSNAQDIFNFGGAHGNYIWAGSNKSPQNNTVLMNLGNPLVDAPAATFNAHFQLYFNNNTVESCNPYNIVTLNEYSDPAYSQYTGQTYHFQIPVSSSEYPNGLSGILTATSSGSFSKNYFYQLQLSNCFSDPYGQAYNKSTGIEDSGDGDVTYSNNGLQASKPPAIEIYDSVPPPAPQDTTPPSIFATALASSYLLNATPVLFAYSAVDSGVGLFYATATIDGQSLASSTTLSFAQSGQHTIMISAGDLAGNVSTSTIVYNVFDNFGGFQSPIKSDGTGIYKQGRTLPIKFQLTDANNQITTSSIAQLFAGKIHDNIVNSDEVALSTSGADTGNYFRVSSNQYIYNLNTSMLSPGTWQLKVKLDDGTEHVVTISIKS